MSGREHSEVREPLLHRLRHRRVIVLGCHGCKARADVIWARRRARGWRTDPSDPGWREEDAAYMQREED